MIIILILYACYSAWTGRAWAAIGLNTNLARSLGINVFRHKLMAFVLACSIVGLIGSFFAHYQAYVTPNTFGMWRNIYIQMYAIMGGMGYAIAGPLVGSAVMTISPEFLRIAQDISPIIFGFVLIFLILFLPSGVIGLWDKRIYIRTSLTNTNEWIKSLRNKRRTKQV